MMIKHSTDSHGDTHTHIHVFFLAVSEKSQHGKYVSEHLKLNQYSLNVPLKTQLLDPFGPGDSGEEGERRDDQVEDVCRRLQALVSSNKAGHQQATPASASWSGAAYSKAQQPPLSLTNSSKYFVINHTYVGRSDDLS